MEISGHPHDDATVLRAGYAYQHASPWRSRRPALIPGVAAPAIDTAMSDPAPPALDEPTRVHVDMMAQRAGLRLTPSQQAQLYEAAPHALAMASRIRRDHEMEAAPASVFSFGGETHRPSDGN
jgi:hypothetical protein